MVSLAVGNGVTHISNGSAAPAGDVAQHDSSSARPPIYVYDNTTVRSCSRCHHDNDHHHVYHYRAMTPEGVNDDDDATVDTAKSLPSS